MKKLILALLFVALISPVFAQTVSEENSSEFYYVKVHVEKVYPSNEGYIVLYRKGINGMATVGIPNEWFVDAAGKAELITLPSGANWPYMTIFYRNGEFSHIRLYVHRSRAHQTWGSIPMGTNVKNHFKDADEIKIEF